MRSVRRVLAGLTVGLAVAGFVIVPSPGHAANPCDPFTGIQYQVGVEKHNQNNRGHKAENPNGMRLIQSTVTCERVSSIYVYRSEFQYIQFGWYEAPAGIPGDCGQTSGLPYLLASWRILGMNQADCLFDNYELDPEPGDYEWKTWAIDNPANDNNFFFVLDGTYLGVTPNVGFANGHGLLGTERAGDDPHGYGHFNNMYYQNYSGWHLWDTSCFVLSGKCDYLDNDPLWAAYRIDYPNHYHIEIRNSPP